MDLFYGCFIYISSICLMYLFMDLFYVFFCYESSVMDVLLMLF